MCIRDRHKADWINLFSGVVSFMDDFVVITGFTMNLIPRSSVMKLENPPMVLLGTRLDA